MLRVSKGFHGYGLTESMLFGRECFNHAEILLKMLTGQKIQSSYNHVAISCMKVYVRLFGVPDIGLQLRALYFTRITRKLRFRKVLDAGCGLGHYSFYLGAKDKTAMIDACDLNRGLIKGAQEILEKIDLTNVHLFEADLAHLCKCEEYDLILLIDVLEHVENDMQVIKNLCRALVNGGILYLHVPHKPVRKFFKSIDRHSAYELRGHVKEGYSLDEIRDLLRNDKLSIRKVVNTFGYACSLANQIFWLALRNLPLGIAAIIFPVFSVMILFDSVTTKTKGNGLLIIAQK